jgi:MFS family permease
MSQCAHPFSAAALVLEWHVLAMFVPSFFTGNLIRRVGIMPILWAGVVLNLVCIAVALSGTDLMQFTVALVALGLGWNFLYVGGTALFTEAYKPQEKTTAQAAMDTTVFSTMTLTSFASGALVTTGGWTFMNVASLVPVGLLALALLWLVQVRRRASLAVDRPSA